MAAAGEITDLVNSHINGLGFGPADGNNFARLADRTDPTSGLRHQYPWLSAKLDRLNKPLHELEGQPAQITAYADVWRKLSTSTEDARVALSAQVENLAQGWPAGPAADSYRHFMEPQNKRLNAISTGSAAMADVATIGGEVCADFRFQIFEVVRKACVDLAKKIPKWLIENGGATAGKAAVAALVAASVAAVLVLLYKLLKKLKAALDALKQLLQKVRSLMEGLGGGSGPSQDNSKVPSRRPRDQYDQIEQNAWANKAYDEFRANDRDLDAITRHSADHERPDGTRGYTREEIAAVKNQLMIEKHPIEDYDTGKTVNRRYDPDSDIAAAWIRLRSGRALPQDHVLIEHELAEREYYRQHPGADYRTAHQAANQRHNWEANLPPYRREDLASDW